MRWFMVVICFTAFLLPGTAVSARTKVLIIHSYHPELTWVAQCNEGIKSVLGETTDFEYFYLDTKRIPEERFQEMAEVALTVVRHTSPDVIMLGDDNALKLLGPELTGSDVPVVFLGINNNPRSYFDSGIPSNVTGILERLQLFPFVRYLSKIVPDLSRALVLMDKSLTSNAIVSTSFANRSSVDANGVEVEYRIAENWEEWQEVVLDSSKYDVLITPTFHALSDSSGQHVDVDEVITWTSRESRIPVFSKQDYTVRDDGVVGGFVVQGVTHGRLAAQMVEQILQGADVGSIQPRMDKFGTFYFNRQQLQRFHLTLPDEILGRAIFR